MMNAVVGNRKAHMLNAPCALRVKRKAQSHIVHGSLATSCLTMAEEAQRIGVDAATCGFRQHYHYVYVRAGNMLRRGLSRLLVRFVL